MLMHCTAAISRIQLCYTVTAMLMSCTLCGDNDSMIMHYIISKGQHQQQHHFPAKI